MPQRYWYHCTQCTYREFRYRNVRRCPDCGGNLVREPEEVVSTPRHPEQSVSPSQHHARQRRIPVSEVVT
jgi:hypothetical protein